MGKIANAVVGTIGTAVVSANCFFAGSNDDAVITQENANTNNITNSNEAVLNIGSAPSEGIDIKDWLSDTSEVIGQAFEDTEKHDARQEESEAVRDSDINEQTAGSAPPNNDNDINASMSDVNESISILPGNGDIDGYDLGSGNALDDAYTFSDALTDGVTDVLCYTDDDADSL